MIINAKFSSTCSACNGPIRSGERVEWTRGAPARHVSCPSEGKPRPVSSRGAPPRHVSPAKVAGELRVSRPSRGRGDGYQVGNEIYLADKDAFYVVIEAGKERGDEDLGYFEGWYAWARVRPTTEAENAAALAFRRAQQARLALSEIPRWLAGQVKRVENLTEEHVPADAWRYPIRSTTAGSEILYASTDAVWLVESSYDDGPRAWRAKIDHADVATLAAAIESLS